MISRTRMVVLPVFLLLVVGLVMTGPTASAGLPRLRWHDLHTGSKAEFRGLSAVSRQVAWVSGTKGTVLRTVDGGKTWTDVSPGSGTGQLEFRDIEAFDADHAVIMSIGDHPGDFRFFWTGDGGQTWTRGYQNTNPHAFYDCMGFWDPEHGIAMSDPVKGRFRILSTENGGESWTVLDPSGMPKALPGEFGFAASGTCLVTEGTSDAWLASGGGARSRVYRTTDRGLTWKVASTPVASTSAGGIFSLAVNGPHQLVAVGGDFEHPDGTVRTSAYSRDGGKAWRLGGNLHGYRSGSAWLPHHSGVIAVGPTGTDVTYDRAHSWHAVDQGSLDSVACTSDGACWGSGLKGRVAVLRGL